jgi:RimJ/RimL family protein N-acetyltransferase
MDSNPNVHRFVGNAPVKSLEDSERVIRILRQQYNDFGIGRWAMLEKATGDFIGWIGFKYMTETVNKHKNYHDFGYRLREEFWNQGYATEGAKGCLKYGTEGLKLKQIFAATHVDNVASRRVLEKCGFSLVEIFGYDAEAAWRTHNEPTTWYAFVQQD